MQEQLVCVLPLCPLMSGDCHTRKEENPSLYCSFHSFLTKKQYFRSLFSLYLELSPRLWVDKHKYFTDCSDLAEWYESLSSNLYKSLSKNWFKYLYFWINFKFCPYHMPDEILNCAWYGWGGVRFLHSGWCGSVFWICAHHILMSRT